MKEGKHMPRSPCKKCIYLCEGGEACCAGLILGIPWAEANSFIDWDGELQLPTECDAEVDFKAIVDEVLYQLGEIINKREDKELQQKFEELEAWVGWLREVQDGSRESLNIQQARLQVTARRIKMRELKFRAWDKEKVMYEVEATK